MAIVVKLDDLLHDRRMTLTSSQNGSISRWPICRFSKPARRVRSAALEAICDVLGCQPGDLLEFHSDSGAANSRAA
jgi:putative transcriptional regulator